MERKPWTKIEEAIVRKFYADAPTKVIAAALSRPEPAVYQLARRLGLRKSEAYLSSPGSGRLDGVRGSACRFPKGHQPWNKGQSFSAGGRSAETRFKSGNPRTPGCLSAATESPRTGRYSARSATPQGTTVSAGAACMSWSGSNTTDLCPPAISPSSNPACA